MNRQITEEERLNGLGGGGSCAAGWLVGGSLVGQRLVELSGP